MTRALSLSAVALVVVAASACGDVYAEPGGDPVDLPRSDATAILPKDVPTQCPAERPRENAPCQLVSSTCEYGPSADLACNQTYVCTPDAQRQENFWLRRDTDHCFARACPAEPSAIESLDGQPCSLPVLDAVTPSDADEAICAMTNGTCACTTGPDAAHAHERRWVCIRAGSSGCPTRRPHAGEGCVGGAWCDYGSCAWKRGLLMQCQDSHWNTGGAPCN